MRRYDSATSLIVEIYGRTAAGYAHGNHHAVLAGHVPDEVHLTRDAKLVEHRSESIKARPALEACGTSGHLNTGDRP